MSQTHKQNQLTKASWNKIYSSAEQVAKSFKNDWIHISSLKAIIDRSRMKPNITLGTFPNDYNKCLDVLIYHSNKASITRSGQMPLALLKQYIDTLKNNL